MAKAFKCKVSRESNGCTDTQAKANIPEMVTYQQQVIKRRAECLLVNSNETFPEYITYNPEQSTA